MFTYLSKEINYFEAVRMLNKKMNLIVDHFLVSQLTLKTILILFNMNAMIHCCFQI